MDGLKDQNISILINHKSDCQNDKNWLSIKKRYDILLPNAEICVGHYGRDQYNKSFVINNAAKKATKDVFIIADSNVAFNIESLKKGLELLKEYAFIIPYGDLIYLNQNSTRYFRNLPSDTTINNAFFAGYKKEPNHMGAIFIVSRNCFEAIEGFDEKITEWDEENMDFAKRLFDKFGNYKRLTAYSIWSLFYDKIYYPSYIKGINVEKILKMKYPTGAISWDIRI